MLLSSCSSFRFLCSRCPTSTLQSLPKHIIKHHKLSLSSSNMEAESASVLVLCGKSNVENEFALSLKSNNVLRFPDSNSVSICLHSEIGNLHHDSEGFQVDHYMDVLSTSQFGRFLMYSPRLGSTHDVVSHNFSELPIGAVCIADVQTKGRGRSKNVWESPKGCLLFSFTIQMEDGRVVPLVQYVVSLAVTGAIKDICQKKGIQHLDVKIKWPNDLYLDGLKVGGILCTSTYKSKKFNVSAGKQSCPFHCIQFNKHFSTICSSKLNEAENSTEAFYHDILQLACPKISNMVSGIGLNVSNKKPTTCLNAILQKLTPVAHELQREDIMAAFFNKFEDLYTVFMGQGFQLLEPLYYKTWLHSGQRVIVQDKNDNQDQVVENVVTIQGLTPSGYLLAISEDGQTCELHPDGNSLDFFKGLLRRKLA